MGKSYSKQEEKEVIIAQTAVGENSASGITEKHMYPNNILLSTILAVTGLIILIVLFKYYKRCHKAWMRKELRGELLRRIQTRLSGRVGLRKEATDEEVGNQMRQHI